MATPKTPGRRASKPAEAENPKDAGIADTAAGDTPGSEALSSTDASEGGVSMPASSDARESETVEPAAGTDLSGMTEETGAAPLQSSPDAASAEDARPDETSVDTEANAPTSADAPTTDSTKAWEGQSDAPVSPPPASPSATSPPARSSGGAFFALLLGGVAAAALGFVMARYVLPEGWPVPGASPLQAQIERQTTEIQALRDELSGLSAAPDLSPVEAEIATLRTDLGQVREAAEAARHAAATAANTPADLPEDILARLDQMSGRLEALESRPAQPEGVAAAEDLAGLEAAIASLRDGLAAQEARTADAAEAARAEVARMQAEAEAARQATEAEADSTLQQAALAQIEAALLSGAAYIEPLAALTAAGHDIGPVLTENAESGLPTLAGLAERFDEPARAAIAAELRSDMGDTLGDRIGSFLRAQTGARSLSPREGADADAVLSRAEAALQAGDLDRALAELAALSDPAQAEMAGWVVQAERHQDAAAALAALAAAVTER